MSIQTDDELTLGSFDSPVKGRGDHTTLVIHNPNRQFWMLSLEVIDPNPRLIGRAAIGNDHLHIGAWIALF
jgi:hypothetical protein